MFEDKLKNLLKGDEQLITMVRKYFFVFSSQLTVGIVFIIASFFFLYPLFNWGLWGVIIFFVMILGEILAPAMLISISFDQYQN